MRFLSMIRIDENSGQAQRAAHERHGQADRQMTREGRLSAPPGFGRPRKGARAAARGKLSTVDGPFTETKEVIGGFAILEAGSMQEAIELTKRFLKIHGDEWDIECEVRQLDGADVGAEGDQG